MGMTRADASRIVAVLLGAFPHARITAQTPMVYEDALLDLELSHVDAAVRSLILTERDFIPSIAKIREAAIERRDGRGRPGGDAWRDARLAVGAFGRDRVPVFADPLVARAIAALGWREYCDSDESDPSYRARFIALYERYQKEDASDRQIAGILPPPQARGAITAGAAIEHVMRQIAANVAHHESTIADEETPPWER